MTTTLPQLASIICAVSFVLVVGHEGAAHFRERVETMVGTENQIAWAIKIRDAQYAQLEDTRWHDRIVHFDEFAAHIKNEYDQQPARYWIDSRNSDDFSDDWIKSKANDWMIRTYPDEVESRIAAAMKKVGNTLLEKQKVQADTEKLKSDMTTDLRRLLQEAQPLLNELNGSYELYHQTSMSKRDMLVHISQWLKMTVEIADKYTPKT